MQYPQYILGEAAELNDDNESVETKFYSLFQDFVSLVPSS